MTSSASGTIHPRERLLNIAGKLFYANGIHTVGVEQLVREAGVTRATFYRHFAGKEGLVIAYLQERDARVKRAVEAILRAHRGRDALLEIVAMIADSVLQPEFRGCGFLNAAAEYPDPRHHVRLCVAEHRDWFRGVLRDVAHDAGHPDPDRAARALMVLRDGAMAAGYLDDPHDVARTLREAAETILDA
ncbi:MULTISPECIES: TetR/AcrR family transcriptional regulator [Streptomyces]|uniref:TetR/AcrR family transcriptional regulator n=1 Tax=Streptomyces TaxID=1883 RepID=UPI0004C0EEFB|nr:MULTISPECIES: TetR/AcrR family transcriptional regulator [Streptomyces]KOT61549.1 TetR family transcriptional regulator [Streptomyces rimosus subsp. rimosus]